jgi:hypothetical protein
VSPSADRRAPKLRLEPFKPGWRPDFGGRAGPLRLEIARESLTKLLRTRKLGLMVTLDEGAKLTLTGKGRLERRRNGHNQAGKSKARAKLVPMFVRKSVSFPGPGAEKVNLTLSRNGRRRLASLHKATLVISGTANATAGGKTTTTVAVTVKR